MTEVAPETAAGVADHEDNGSPLRLFIALAIGPVAKEHIRQVQRDLERFIGGYVVAWEPPDNLHLSLRFLGDTPREWLDPTLETLRGVAAAHSPFVLGTWGVGVFSQDGRPRVLHLRAGPDTVRFMAMQESVESAVQALGLWPPANFPFNPHVTIGRVSRGLEPPAYANLEQTLDGMALDARPSRLWPVDRIGLYQSVYVDGEPTYRCLGEAPLEGKGGGGR